MSVGVEVDSGVVNYAVLNDEQLVDLTKEGDEQALNVLVKTYLPKISKRVHKFVPETDAEDVTQEIFLALVNSIDGFKGRSAFAIWFHKIVVNRIADYHRKRSRRKEGTLSKVDMEEFGGVFDPYKVTDAEITVEDILIKLPEIYEEVLRLKFFGGLSFTEIAEFLDLTYEAARSRYRRAMEAFADELRTLRNLEVTN